MPRTRQPSSCRFASSCDLKRNPLRDECRRRQPGDRFIEPSALREKEAAGLLHHRRFTSGAHLSHRHAPRAKFSLTMSRER